MRQFSIDLGPYLAAGLRHEPYDDLNFPALVSCTGGRVLQKGLTRLHTITNVLSSPLTADTYPFPQLLRGKAVTLLAEETQVSLVDETDWSTSALSLVDRDLATSTIIADGGPWHFAEFFDTWFLHNSENIIYKTGASDSYIHIPSTEMKIASCASNGTRLFLGGFDSTALWDTDYEAFWETWVNRNGQTFGAPQLGANFVMWSSIGADFRFLYDLAAMKFGWSIPASNIWTADHPFIMNVLKKNQLGFIPMPWQGSVCGMKALGRSMMVYGQNGIALLYPVSEPAPTFGVKSYPKLPVLSRSSFGGSDEVHLLVTADYSLWLIDSEGSVKYLGYAEHISTLAGDIMISYDASQREFHISGSNKRYVLTQYGLTCSDVIMSSCFYTNQSVVGALASSENYLLTLETNRFDFGNADIKTITDVHAYGTHSPGAFSSAFNSDFDLNSQGQVAIGSAFTPGAELSWSSWTNLNNSSWCRIQRAGVEFALRFRWRIKDNATLTTIKPSMQQQSKAGIRGINLENVY